MTELSVFSASYSSFPTSLRKESKRMKMVPHWVGCDECSRHQGGYLATCNTSLLILCSRSSEPKSLSPSVLGCNCDRGGVVMRCVSNLCVNDWSTCSELLVMLKFQKWILTIYLNNRKPQVTVPWSPHQERVSFLVIFFLKLESHAQKIDLSYIFRKSDVSFYSKMPNWLTKIHLPPFLHQPGHKSFSQQTLYARDQRSNSQKLIAVDETLNKTVS